MGLKDFSNLRFLFGSQIEIVCHSFREAAAEMGWGLIGLIESVLDEEDGTACAHDHAGQNEDAADDEGEPCSGRLGEVRYLLGSGHEYLEQGSWC